MSSVSRRRIIRLRSASVFMLLRRDESAGSGEAEGRKMNGANGISDIEGKVVSVALSECGRRVSFNYKLLKELLRQLQRTVATPHTQLFSCMF
jgi:hypothetical protein